MLIVDAHAIDQLLQIGAHLATALEALEKLPKCDCRDEAQSEIEKARNRIYALKAWQDIGTEVVLPADGPGGTPADGG